MQYNPFRRGVGGSLLATLQRRKQLYLSYPEGQYYKPKTRNSAYCKITKGGLTLSTLEDTFSETYRRPGVLKPPPRLIKAEIERVGNDASTVNLSLRIRGTFEVFNYEEFDRYAQTFLITDAKDTLTITMGYVNPTDNTPPYTIKNCLIVYGLWKTTDQNTFICDFEARGPGEALTSMDMGSFGRFEGNYFYKNDFLWGWHTEKERVQSYNELLLYDAQQSGQIYTTDVPDGTALSVPGISNPKLNITSGPHIAIYKPVGGLSGQFNWGERWNKAWNLDPAATNTQEYFTLEYIVGRLINEIGIWLFFVSNADKIPQFLHKIRVGFPDKPHSYLPPHKTDILRSADPFSMLILGQGAGNYLKTFPTPKDVGKDWENSGILAVVGDKIDYRKILFHRDTIVSVFEQTSNMVSVKNKSEDVGGSASDTRTLPIRKFLENLFTVVKLNTGGFINLSLVLDDEDPEHLIIRIIDEHYNDNSINVWRFGALVADGSTRSAILRSRHPSNEFHAALLQNIMSESRPMDQVNQTANVGVDNLDEIAKEAYENIYHNKMPKEGFKISSVQAARGLMTKYRNSQPTSEVKERNIYVWNLELNLVIDGVGGWQVGHHVTVDNMPKLYQPLNNIAYVVKRVLHTVEGNDWTTELDAILTAIPDNSTVSQ